VPLPNAFPLSPTYVEKPKSPTTKNHHSIKSIFTVLESRQRGIKGKSQQNNGTLCNATARNENVARFNVLVNNALGVEACQTNRYILRKTPINY
jgi:hypothetical protein